MTQKCLGKIIRVSFGWGGYQDMQFGLWLVFQGSGLTPWCLSMETHGKLTEDDRLQAYADVYRALDGILGDANVCDVRDLIGKPVEVVFDGNVLKSWRILKEVL